MTRHGFDITSGIIIGGDPEPEGSLHRYDTGAQQGPKFHGATAAEIERQARAWFADNGGRELWPDGLELRLWNC